MNRDKNKQKSKVVLDQSILKYYEKYKHPGSNVKKQVLQGYHFEIDDQYDIIDTVGSGAYGIVAAVKDTTVSAEEPLVAMKKIEKAFEHKIFTKRTLRELKILRLLHHDNIINIHHILLPPSRDKFDDIYLINQLMESDLSQIIRSPQPLSDDHIQFFIYQILIGLKYMHSANIIHRDLKPKNLLVNSNCDLKICDFGLARAVFPHSQMTNNKAMTDYVTTRWYRAPELLLAWDEHFASVDVWSVGCILAELLKRKPIFAGTDTKNQIDIIIEMMGSPKDEDIKKIQNEISRNYVKKLPKKKGKDMRLIFPDANPLAIDLMKKMLVFDPFKRISVADALEHPYLKELHSPEEEPTTTPVNFMEFEFEIHNLTLQQYKDLIYEEILIYHFPEFKKDYFEKIGKGESVISHVINNENAKIVKFLFIQLDPEDSDEDDDDYS